MTNSLPMASHLILVPVDDSSWVVRSLTALSKSLFSNKYERRSASTERGASGIQFELSSVLELGKPELFLSLL